ncbi:MAG: DUF3990 domain-containing protein [Coriobacteriales bacterium]
MHGYRFADDIELVCELLEMTGADLARELGVAPVSVSRWKTGASRPSEKSTAAFYDLAFEKGLRLNQIKAQLQRELIGNRGHVSVFHGAKGELEGELSLEHSKPGNDFGRGFYCGESLEQSAMFVVGYPSSSIYILDFDPEGLERAEYGVDQDWMLTVAWFRGKLRSYAGHERIDALASRVAKADYVVAPIADNRMFETIDSFIDGEITDVQCQHCLSATNLGSQYVFTSEAALRQVAITEHCFLAGREKRHYLESRKQELAVGSDKVKAARRLFRGQGRYIEEILS